jgi:hypothetical protein
MAQSYCPTSPTPKSARLSLFVVSCSSACTYAYGNAPLKALVSVVFAGPGTMLDLPYDTRVEKQGGITQWRRTNMRGTAGELLSAVECC